jgi:hypothetical protein
MGSGPGITCTTCGYHELSPVQLNNETTLMANGGVRMMRQSADDPGARAARCRPSSGPVSAFAARSSQRLGGTARKRAVKGALKTLDRDYHLGRQGACG